MNEEQKEKISNFLENNKFAVISSNSISGYPESAIVGISNTDENHVVFRSLSNSRKNQNIKLNPKVSLVVLSDNKEWKTLQIEGLARLLTKEEASVVEDKHCEKNKAYEAFKGHELNEYFMIEITWGRYCDLSPGSQEFFEFGNKM